MSSVVEPVISDAPIDDRHEATMNDAAASASSPDPAAARPVKKKTRRSHINDATSGKNSKNENFPVGSFLLPKRLRPHVAKFYRYARAIDDVADDPNLSPEEKVVKLHAFRAVLEGEKGFGSDYDSARALRLSLAETGVTTRHGADLVAAFVQDANKNRYQTWGELLGYCELSANPVGRYLLDLHGEDEAGYRYSDALCTALQIINHLQDCRDDYLLLNRVYIIGDWMAEEGAKVSDVSLRVLNPAMRRVTMRMLDGCEDLMAEAKQLPSALKSKHLAMESAVIIRLAIRLIKLLRNGDPLAERIDLTKFDFASAGMRGAIAGYFSAGSGAKP
ncbi:MAG: squalene synthase HpnC [Marinicaulis sp.]|nr:squalene synthase HpnC [Marinicaulis sp.]